MLIDSEESCLDRSNFGSSRRFGATRRRTWCASFSLQERSARSSITSQQTAIIWREKVSTLGLTSPRSKSFQRYETHMSVFRGNFTGLNPQDELFTVIKA